MYLLRRTVGFIVGCAIVLAAHARYDRVASPKQAADVAVASLNGGEDDAARARATGELHSAADDATGYAFAILTAVCFVPPLRRAVARTQARVRN